MAHIGTRKLKLEVDGTERFADVSSVEIRSAESDSDFVTFEQASQGGGRDYVVAITLAQDAASGSLWSEVFDNAGTEVPIVVMPYGNAVPSVSEPHFEATATIVEPDGALLGGEADKSTSARFTIEVEWPLEGKPTKITAP